MSLYVRALSPETYRALELLSESRGWHTVAAWMEPEPVAWLAYLLEAVADEDHLFPRGKWATIQLLQQMLREHAVKEVNRKADAA